MHPLLTLPYLTISLHEAPVPVPVLELQWLSYIGSADFRAAAQQALAFSQQHQVRAWVADDRQLGAVRPRDLEWSEQAILTPLSELGLQRFAQLPPLDVLNRRTVGMMYERAQPSVQFEMRTFENLAQARAWAGGGAE